MSKKLTKLLRTELSASLPIIAKILESKGRKRDKILAHINEDEAELLRMHGGSGTINPETGLMEFDDGSFSAPTYYNPEYYSGAGGASPTPIESAFPVSSPSSVSAPTDYSPSYSNVSAPQNAISSPYSTDGFITGGPQTFQTTPTPQAAQLAPGAKDLLDQTPPPAAPETSALDKLSKALGVSSRELLAGGMGLAGVLQGRQVAAQGQQAQKQLSAMAKPYRQRGTELLTAAERGELTPVGQQQLQALQARLAQGVEARGGVGAQQAQAEINAYRDQLIQAQYDLGLKVLNVADNIAAGAIKTGLAADQYVNELTSNYMTNIARTLYGQSPQTFQPTPAQ